MVLKTNGDDKIVELSREFLDAVNSLRKDLGECTREELELEQEKYKRIYHLGLKDGLSAELITKKVEERHFVQTHCRECNLPVFGYKHTTCPACKKSNEKREWEKYCEEKKKNEHMIERYCYDIRGETPNYDLTFEESEKSVEECWKYRQEQLGKERESERGYIPEDKTEAVAKSEWEKQKKRNRLLAIEQRKERKANWELKMNSPVHMFSKMIDKIGCRCEAEDMRAGKFCDTCRLTVKVNEYTLDLFKRASEGRTSDN